MEEVSSAPTVKQRRKFEHLEMANMNNHDTSSVNHVSDVYTTDNLCKHEHEEAQTLGDCCKKLIRCKSAFQGRFTGSSSEYSGQKDPPKMHGILLYAILMLPFTVTIFGTLTTYTMYRYESLVNPAIVYISETALNYPQSSIFSLTLHLAAVFVGLILYLRHLTLVQFIRDHGQGGIKKSWIETSKWLIVLTSVSIQLTGNFPAVDFGQLSVHHMSATTFLVCTTLYSAIQCKITYQTIGLLCDRRIYYLRVALSTVILISLFGIFIPGFISWWQFNGKSYRNWQPSDGGYICHVISVIAEWLHVNCSNLFITTFIHESRSISVELPVVKITYIMGKEKADFKTRAL